MLLFVAGVVVAAVALAVITVVEQNIYFASCRSGSLKLLVFLRE